MQICKKLHVDLSEVACGFVRSSIWVKRTRMDIIQKSVTFFQLWSLNTPIEKKGLVKKNKKIVYYFVYKSHYLLTK